MPRLCDGSGVLPCRCPASVVGGHAYACTRQRRCDGCPACGPDPAEAERERRDDETWYYSRKAADQPRLF